MSISSSYDNVSSDGTKSNDDIDAWEDVSNELHVKDAEAQVIVEFPPSLLGSDRQLLPAEITSIANSSVATDDRASGNADKSNRSRAIPDKKLCILKESKDASTASYDHDAIGCATQSSESMASYVYQLRGCTIQSFADSEAWTCASAVASTSSETTISGFSCLGISGERLVRCRRCTLLNDGTSCLQICGACGQALNGNPSEWIDELLAKQMQANEEKIAFSAVKSDERKRAALARSPLIERASALVDDIQKVVSDEKFDGSIRPLSLADLTFHVSKLIGLTDDGLNPSMISLAFYFCHISGDSGVSNFDKIRLDDRGTYIPAPSLHSYPNLAFQSALRQLAPVQSNEVIAAPRNQPGSTLFPLNEDESVKESDYLGWVVIRIPCRQNSDDPPVHRYPLDYQCFPLLAFEAVLRNTEPMQRLFRNLSQTCLDFFQTDWSASTFHLFDDPPAKKVRSNDSEGAEMPLDPNGFSSFCLQEDITRRNIFTNDQSNAVHDATVAAVVGPVDLIQDFVVSSNDGDECDSAGGELNVCDGENEHHAVSEKKLIHGENHFKKSLVLVGLLNSSGATVDRFCCGFVADRAFGLIVCSTSSLFESAAGARVAEKVDIAIHCGVAGENPCVRRYEGDVLCLGGTCVDACIVRIVSRYDTSTSQVSNGSDGTDDAQICEFQMAAHVLPEDLVHVLSAIQVHEYASRWTPWTNHDFGKTSGRIFRASGFPSVPCVDSELVLYSATPIGVRGGTCLHQDGRVAGILGVPDPEDILRYSLIPCHKLNPLIKRARTLAGTNKVHHQPPGTTLSTTARDLISNLDSASIDVAKAEKSEADPPATAHVSVGDCTRGQTVVVQMGLPEGIRALLHGAGKMPRLNVTECQRRTTYTGAFAGLGADHPTCHWFWEILQGFDPELQARFLYWIAVTADAAESAPGSVTTAFVRDATTTTTTETAPWELQGVNEKESSLPLADRSTSLDVSVVRVSRRGDGNSNDGEGGRVVIVLPVSTSKDDLRRPLEEAVRGASTGVL